MNLYKCVFTLGYKGKTVGDVSKINATSPEEAASIFIDQSTVACSSEYSHVMVNWGGVLTGGIKYIPVEKLKTGKSHNEIAEEHLERLRCAVAETTTGSYFELPPSCRSEMTEYMMDTVIEFENRPLVENEIKFIHTWLNLKDRNSGESLIAKRLASLPPAKREKSKFGNMMLLGMMASTIRLENSLEGMQEEISSIGEDVSEMQEDVGDMNEGFGFEE